MIRQSGKLRTGARWLGRGVAGFAAGAVIYLLAAVVGGLVGNGAPAPADTNDLYRVGLAIGPIHTDFLLPLDPDVRRRFAFVGAAGVPIDDPAAEWLVVGWGARGFYTTVGDYSDVTIGAVARGIVGDTSVMRIDAVGRIGDYGGIDLLALTPDQFDGLTDAILAGFVRGADGVPVALPDEPGFTLTDSFFEGADGFHLLRTCNVWVSDVLAKAGVAFGIWTPTPFAVRLAVWRFVGM